MRTRLLSVLPCQIVMTLTSALSMVAPAHAATDIEVWHSMRGVNAQTFNDLVARFNADNKTLHVSAEYKGDEDQTVQAGIAAAHGKNGPELLMVQDELSGEVLRQPGLVRPLFEVLPLANSPDFKSFIPGTVAFMKDARGRLYGLPLLASVPVYFYNKDAYRKAGLDPDAPPKTWRELQVHLLALKAPATGIKCGYTTSDPTWIHVENLATWHGETIATRNNGLDGPGAVLNFNDLLHVRHLALMESWVKAEIFTYSGRHHEADARFMSGECATLTSTSGVTGEFLAHAKFKFGVAPMPYYEEGARQPVNTLVSGSSLWVMNGKSQADYAGVAKFLAFLATPVAAAEWHQKTGNLPLTSAAYAASQTSSFYEQVSGIGDVMKVAATSVGAVTRGIRLPHYDKVRDIIDAELEAVWTDKKAPKQGLDDAVRIGNLAMKGEAGVAEKKDAAPSVKEKKTAKKPSKK